MAGVLGVRAELRGLDWYRQQRLEFSSSCIYRQSLKPPCFCSPLPDPPASSRKCCLGPGKETVLGPSPKSPVSLEEPHGAWLVGISQHHAWQEEGSRPENAIIPGN